MNDISTPLADGAHAGFSIGDRLLAAYLALGARICGAPAIDRAFKTIDFLTILDLDNLPPRALEKYVQWPDPANPKPLP